ncbi:MAG TPA: membrane protein insertion efficiency factor YidD [Chloroflexota bacterium]|nr:membrane protein insertion efficiency factor YidD [Chloroflexota bacterium]
MKHVLLVLINLYRGLISALIPTSCRFYPTCSAYGKEAIERYGARFGLWLTLRRLVRCHPWSKGGYDPVP